MNAAQVPEAQAAAAVLMIAPEHFADNPETLQSNAFQLRGAAPAAAAIEARHEWTALAAALEIKGVRVLAFEGQAGAALPDEIFPNNWLSLHGDGTVVLYPMLAPNRRRERRPALVEALRVQHGYRVDRIVDLTSLEREGAYLEGTGSLVLDRQRRIAYACRSARTHAAAAAAFARALGYDIVLFDAQDAGGRAIYHTNVLLSLGTTFGVVCAAVLPDSARRRNLLRQLAASGREIIEIDPPQLAEFAANLLELRGRGDPVIALSRRAERSLRPSQRAALERHGELLVAQVDTIEAVGGGGVRCMLAEVALPRAASSPAGAAGAASSSSPSDRVG
jgi:hypothetical protein